MTNRIIENTSRALVGLDNFHFSKVVSDTEAGLVYGEMVAVPNTIEINVNLNSSLATLFADNKPAIVHSVLGVADVSIVKASLPNEFLAEILGNKMQGALRHITPDQVSPYVGLAWRQLYSDGSYAYVKLYKGKFSEPENNSKTQEDGVEFQTKTINANFVATTFKAVADDGKEFSYMCTTVDETDPDYTNEGNDWFKAMLAPIAGWVTATSYVVGNLVVESNKIYRCAANHTSGATFAADLTAVKWVLVGDYI